VSASRIGASRTWLFFAARSERSLWPDDGQVMGDCERRWLVMKQTEETSVEFLDEEMEFLKSFAGWSSGFAKTSAIARSRRCSREQRRRRSIRKRNRQRIGSHRRRLAESGRTS
jgi:hypothetical protein